MRNRAVPVIVKDMHPRIHHDIEILAVIVKIDKPIPVSADLDALLIKTHRTMDNLQKDSYDYRKLLDKLVNDRLLIQEASALGIDEDESLLEYLDKGRKENARHLFVRTMFRPEVKISDEEIHDYFVEYYRKIKIRTVAVHTLEQAEEIAAKIEAGAPMDSIAREISLDSRRFKGGLHSLKYWADVENTYRAATEGVEVGRLSKPFKYNQVYSILRVEERSDADMADLDKFEKKIRSFLTVEARRQAWVEFMDKLKQQMPVSVDNSVLAKIEADRDVLFRGEFLAGTDATVLSVSSEHRVTESELRKEVSHTAMSAGTSPFDSLLQWGVDSKTEDLLLLTAADRQGFLDSAAIVGKYHRSLESALIELYLQEMVVPQIVFNKDEFQAYYDEHLEDFRLPNEYDLHDIVVESQETADKVVSQLNDGADWDYTARQFSIAKPHKHDESEWVTLESFPSAVSRDLGQLGIGQHSQAYRTVEGWVIFQVNNMRPGKVKTIEEADPEIREVMFQRKFNEVLDHHLNTMKKNSQIEYNEQEIEKYFSGQP